MWKVVKSLVNGHLSMGLFSRSFLWHYSTKYFESWTKFFHPERPSWKNNVWEKSRYEYNRLDSYSIWHSRLHNKSLKEFRHFNKGAHNIKLMLSLILLVLIHKEVFGPLCLQNPSWSKQCRRQFFLSYCFKSLKQNETLSLIRLGVIF